MYPTTGIYGSILQAYFGSAPPSQKQALWNNFLVNGAPPGGQPPSQPEDVSETDTGSPEEFLEFILYKANNLGSIIQSPEEIQKRQVMFQLFSSLLKMLSTIQNTVTVEASNLVFLTKWEQQYTQMLTKAPVYTSVPTNQWSPSTTDPTAFTFGYNSISVDDMAAYLASPTGPTAGIQMVSPKIAVFPAGNTANLIFQAFYYNGVPYIKLLEGVYDSNGVAKNPPNFVIAVTPVTITTTPGGNLFQETKAAWSSTLMQFLTNPNQFVVTPQPPSFGTSQNITFTPPSSPTAIGGYHLATVIPNPLGGSVTEQDNFPPFSIPWRDVAPFPNPSNAKLTTDQQQQNSNASGKRAELNSLLQQYIQSTTAHRQTIQNYQSTQQNNLSTTKEAITQEGSLLSSMIQTWQSVLSSIFR